MTRSILMIALFALGLALGALLRFDRSDPDEALEPSGAASRTETALADHILPMPGRRPRREPLPPGVETTFTPVAEDEPEAMPRVDTTAQVLLSGNLVDDLGRPLSRMSCHWRVTFGPQVRTGYLQTGEGGQFAITIRGALHVDALGELEIEPGEPFRGIQIIPPATRRALTPLPDPMVRGEVDLGNLRLEALPLICAGQILDQEGRPIANAEVWADVHRPGHNGPFGHKLELKADGSFELRLADPPLAVDLRAECDGKLASVLTGVSPGSRGLDLRLQRAASLSGWVPGEEPATDFVLIDSVGRRHDAPTRWQLNDGRIKFEFRELKPGPAHLRIGGSDRALVDRQILLAPGANEIAH